MTNRSSRRRNSEIHPSQEIFRQGVSCPKSIALLQNGLSNRTKLVFCFSAVNCHLFLSETTVAAPPSLPHKARASRRHTITLYTANGSFLFLCLEPPFRCLGMHTSIDCPCSSVSPEALRGDGDPQNTLLYEHFLSETNILLAMKMHTDISHLPRQTSDDMHRIQLNKHESTQDSIAVDGQPYGTRAD